jgi:mRNA-degrading endonuclease toxin of MazEF toxin-antitoxin module
LCHQVTTLDRAKLGVRLGRLPDDYLRDVERGLMAALQIGSFAR